MYIYMYIYVPITIKNSILIEANHYRLTTQCLHRSEVKSFSRFLSRYIFKGLVLF